MLVTDDFHILITGVNSFLLSMSTLDDRSLYLALQQCRRLGAFAFIHAENGSFIELVSTFGINNH
jgi:dihydroorotase-like cyclic amidohydrolase